MVGFNPNDIFKGAGAILVVFLVGMMVFAPFLEAAGISFKTNNSALVTFIGFALIMGIALTAYDWATSGVGFSVGKLIPLLVLVVMLFLTIKYGNPLIAKLSPSAASVFPLG